MTFNFCPDCGSKLSSIPYPQGQGWVTRKECPNGHKVEIMAGDYGPDTVIFPVEWSK